ncbi:MAG: DedA family protein [Candidatus Yanofskybacteria bacterium]|nr:DedA family protein [Candidatus Yanofskybacteria bacterium]
MLNFISLVGQWSLDVLNQGGYLGVFLLSIADRLTFQFIPGEVVFSLLGFLISQAKFNFALALALTVGGNFVGDAIIYWVSLRGGRRFVEKFGRYFFISAHDLNHTEKLFEKHGGKLIFWGRFIPIIVTFISIPAGLARMNFAKFSIYTLFGSLPRNFILIFLGFTLGENWSKVIEFLEKGQFVMILILAAVIVWYIIRHIRKKHLTHN